MRVKKSDTTTKEPVISDWMISARSNMVSSHTFRAQHFKARASYRNILTRLLMHFNSSKLPGSGSAFPNHVFSNNLTVSYSIINIWHLAWEVFARRLAIWPVCRPKGGPGKLLARSTRTSAESKMASAEFSTQDSYGPSCAGSSGKTSWQGCDLIG